MSANTAPIFSLTPHIGTTKIATTAAVTGSDGTSSGASPVLLYNVFGSGVNGSFVQRVRFNTVASQPNVNSVATTLRVFLSSVSASEGSAVGATTNANTQLLTEISVPIIASANSTNASNYFEIPLNIGIPASKYILVTQHIAQTANQNWQATAIGGDY